MFFIIDRIRKETWLIKICFYQRFNIGQSFKRALTAENE